MARDPAYRHRRVMTAVGLLSGLSFVVSMTAGFGAFSSESLASQQVNTAGGMSVTSVVLAGDPGGTALTETVNDMLPGDYRERVVDLTLPYDADVIYSVKAQVLDDETSEPIAGVTQLGDSLNVIEATNTGLAATDFSDLNAPAGQGGLFVEIYRCTGIGNSYTSTNGVVTSATDDREIACTNSGTPQGAKGNGTGVTHADVSFGNGLASLSAGAHLSCGLDGNNRLWCWGRNNQSQLGDGTTTDCATPLQVGSDTNWQTITAGNTHTCAIKTTGTLWCWGSNSNGRTGLGTTTGNTTTPTQVGSDTNWQTITAGNTHTCAIKTTGTLWCWGSNSNGRTGLGTTTGNTTTPTQVGSDTNWQTITAGNQFTCAKKSNNTLWCWGYNQYGQLGDGTQTQQAAPIQSGSATNWQAIATGDSHVCATRSDGTLWCWGRGFSGELGNGGVVNVFSAQQVGSDTNWSDVSLGNFHSCATKTTGALWCWGENGDGQIGIGTRTAFVTTPAAVGVSTAWIDVDLGSFHSCGRQSNGRTSCWGDNVYGQLGDGSTTQQLTPTQITQTSDWQSVSAGDFHTCGIKTTGSLWCWGDNAMGQVGDGSSILIRDEPLQIGTETNWQSISANDRHTCAIKSTGTLWCWGTNGNGELGDGTTTQRESPTQVGVDSNWASVNAGFAATCATKTTGTLWCWGTNGDGQLGDGTTTQRESPTQVGVDSNWASVDAGNGTTCATKTTGTLWCWGWNLAGQLGNGTTTGSVVPAQVGTDTNWQHLSVENHTCATKTTGTLWCWGYNNAGQVGNNSTTNQLSPLQIGSDSDWLAPVTGRTHTCVPKTSNALYCWGDNGFGQLGDGTRTDQLVPTQTPPGSSWQSISSTADHVCAITTASLLYCWGQNDIAQTGNGYSTVSPLTSDLPDEIAFSTPTIARPAGQTLRLLIRIRFVDDGTTDGRQNTMLGEQVVLTHRFALVDRTAGAV